jgi:hypothetical protein
MAREGSPEERERSPIPDFDHLLNIMAIEPIKTKLFERGTGGEHRE